MPLYSHVLMLSALTCAGALPLSSASSAAAMPAAVVTTFSSRVAPNTPPDAPSRPAIRGRIVNAKTGERVIGATVYVKTDKTRNATTGLDGSFRISSNGGPVTIVCACLGYETREMALDDCSTEIELPLTERNVELGEAMVLAHNPGRTEAGARGIEKNAIGVMNVMSAKAIELSPDLTVANALGRISGVTMERSASGEGQYAILRGMDKRYNYTLVNGAKIPSPDNKNRFVPLDIFPAELLDRLEVTKSLTANLEGDGIGGAVNLMMKDAPDRRQLTANFSTGYSALYLDRSFTSFATGTINAKSPNERYGTDYSVTMADFSLKNLATTQTKFVPDFVAGLSYGDRFFNDRLGVLAAFSGQNIHRGKESDIYYNVNNSTYGYTTKRDFSEQQTRLGAHLRLDFRLTERHALRWYGGYLYFRNQQVRDAKAEKEENVRLRLNEQAILNTTLSGEHTFCDKRFKIDWRGVYSKATNKTPDNAQINLTTASTGLQKLAVNGAATRRWERNADEDLAAYLDFTHRFDLGPSGHMDLLWGGMYRDKKRTSVYNEYTFSAATEQRDKVRNRDWFAFDELLFKAPRFGNLSDPLNYDATEKIGAAYAMAKVKTGRWELTAGLRAEHTDQGYFLKYATAGARNEGNQTYWDFLPDFHAKLDVRKKASVRFSYARSINRPSFFEIVPYNIINEDYRERGNPDLKHTVADNFDLRYEFFPSASEQIMAGVFYKRLENPIEYGMQTSGQDTYYTPANFGTAHNMGLELDVTKYFHHFGVKANYTYTFSRIRTNKTVEEANPDPNAETTTVTRTVTQTRPLFGQAAHVANLSLLYKDAESGFDAQLALGYTGKRLVIVSRFKDNDTWQAAHPQLDFSMEKKIGTNGFSLFLKANNLLNTPVIQYVNRNVRNEGLTNVVRYHGHVLERKEWHGQSFVLGARFKL